MKAPPPSIQVRGARIELPFRLRILVREIKTRSAAARKGLEISGFELSDGERAVGAETVSCAPHRAKTLNLAGKTDLPSAKTWLCRSPSYQRFLTQRTSFGVRAGFIGLDHKLFRGQLELIPRDDRLLVVNTVDIESYLAGLVNSEIRSDYPPDAVKAQVIAARSYALATAADRRRADWDFDLYTTEADQVYAGTRREDPQAFRLVRETWGQVLFHREEVLKAFYCSSSGGMTELPKNVWGEESGIGAFDQLAYLARPSPADADISKWSVNISASLGLAWPGVGKLRELRVLERSEGQRVKKIFASGFDGSRTFGINEFRKLLGGRFLKSHLFSILPQATGFLIEGRGFGHGVGLSQIGAREMARYGRSSNEILRFYYPYANVRQLNLSPLPHDPRLRVSAR